MATPIRPKDIPTQATSFADVDEFILDSSANGTRRMTGADLKTQLGGILVKPLSSIPDLATEAAASGYTRIVSDTARGGILKAVNSGTADSINTFASATAGWTWQRPVEGVMFASRHGVVADGVTDNTDALDDLIQWCQSNNYKLLLPPGTILYSSLTALTDGNWIEGQGGINNTILKCTNTSGPALRVKGRSNTLRGFVIASSAARLAATVADGHGIHVEGDDISGTVSLSRNHFEDLYIYNQPLDGIHVAGLWELSLLENVTVADCLRHGFAFDDGTRSGRTYLTSRPFVYSLRRCRAFECAGNGFLFGKSNQTGISRLLYAEQIESLGCGWNTGITEGNQQIIIESLQSILIQPDIEDQQYAESTTSSTGIAKTVRSTPSEGILIGGDECTIFQPYFSSLIQSILSTASIESVKIENPIIFSGNYGIPQADAIEIPSSVTALHFKGKTQSGASNLIKNQSTKGDIWIDGVNYIPTSGSLFNVKSPHVAEEYEIDAGTLEAACNLIAVNGQGGVADSMNRFRYTNAIIGYQGHTVKLIYNGNDITIFNGVVNLITSTGADVMLNSATPVRTLTCFDGTNWFVE